MNRLSKLLLILTFLPCGSALRAQTVDSEVESTVTVTNAAGTTNGQTIAYSGDTRTFTNNPVANPAKQIQATNTIGYVATNLTLHFTRSPFGDGITLEASGTNYVKFLSALNSNLVITLSAGWGTVSYVTNRYTNGTPVVIPIGFEGDKNAATNIASGLVSGIGTYSTNSFGELVTALANFVNLSQSQTVSNKNLVGGSASNLWLQSARLRGPVNHIDFVMDALGIPESPGIRFYDVATNRFSQIIGAGDADVIPLFVWDTNAFTFVDVSGAWTYFGSAALLNVGSALKIFPVTDSLKIYPFIQVTNRWTTENWFSRATITNLTAAGGFLSNVFGLSMTLSNATVIQTTNLQASGGNLSGMTFSGLTGTGLQSSNTVRMGTNVILGDLSLGSVAVASVAAGHNTLDIGTNSYVRVTGTPGQNWTLDQIKAGAKRDGSLCFLSFETGFNVTVANESAAITTGTPDQRLRTLNGGDSTSVGDAFGIIIWNPGLQRWTFAWLNRGSQTANGTLATNAVPFSDGAATNLSVFASSSNKIPLNVYAFVNQLSNALQVLDANSNVLSGFGPTGGLHVGGYSDAGSNNFRVEGNSIHIGGSQFQSSNNVTGTLSVGGATTLSNTLAVVGGSQMQSSNNVTGTLSAGGATTLSNTLAVVGGSQMQSSNNVTGTLSVGGATTLSNTLAVVGGSQMQSSNNVTGTLSVGGNVTATNNVTVTGFVSAGPGSFTGSNATSVALVAVGGASATTNLTEVKNSAGQIVAGTTQDGVPFMRITNSPQNNPMGGRLFLQTASGTANTNTGTTFQSWLGAGDGSLTIPSGLFNQYKQVKGEFNGNYWTSGGSAGNVYTELDIGGSPVLRQMVSGIGATIANQDFRLEFTLTARSVGSSGSMACSGFVFFMNGSNLQPYHFTNQVVTLDNRGALAVDFRGTNAQSVDSFITTDGIMFAR